jgi:aspartyl-tRNA synthetase
MSRGEIDAYTEFVKIYGAKGLAWIKVNDAAKGREGLQSPIVKNLHDAAIAEILARTGAQRRPDLLRRRQGQGGQRRHRRAALKIGHSDFGRNQRPVRGPWAPLWVVDFPMFEYDEEEQALERRAPPVHRAQGRPRGPDGHRPRAPASPRPTTWCSTAGSWAAARCVSTAPRCRPRSSRAEHHARRAAASSSASCSTRCSTARRRTVAWPSGWTASSR